jgi:hypothetical protein
VVAVPGVTGRRPVGPVPRAVIAKELGQHSQGVSVVRDAPISTGIMEPAGHGLLAVPGFEEFVRASS